MVWDNTDDLEALRIGIQAEIDAYKYFQSAMSYFTDPEIINLLASLAREELKHRKQLEEQYRKRSGHRLLYVKLKRKPIRIKPISHLKTDVEILENVLNHEKESMVFYERAAKLTSNASGRDMLEHLAEEEKNHVDFLQAEYNIRKKLRENKLLETEVA
jgi:rubrerythrin